MSSCDKSNHRSKASKSAKSAVGRERGDASEEVPEEVPEDFFESGEDGDFPDAGDGKDD